MRFFPRIGALAVAVAVMTSGCASTANPRDPFEGYNRAMFSFNEAVDQVALKPAAQAYQAVLPSFVQTGIGNFFGNLGDVWTMVNNVLQGKVVDGLSDMMRVAVNSTFGIGGLLDIGSEAGMTKHKEDFGQTVGKWGIKSGPYVVLPIYGSSTLRDTVVFPIEFKVDLWPYRPPLNLPNAAIAVQLVDRRAVLLDASSLVEEAALDKYEFIRDAYMQRRQNLVYDGEPPESRPEPDDGAAPPPASH